MLGSYCILISVYEMGCKMVAVKLAAELQRSGKCRLAQVM